MMCVDPENSPQFLLNLELRQAATRGDQDEVKKLIAAGADVHDGDDAALRAAAYWGHKETVEALLEAGAEPLMIRSALHSALRSAEMNGHTETAKTLREAIHNKLAVSATSSAESF
jgi:ankyrin repeat protein